MDPFSTSACLRSAAMPVYGVKGRVGLELRAGRGAVWTDAGLRVDGAAGERVG
jgi:hypothetical protein